LNRSALTILAVLVSLQALAHQTGSDETRELRKERDRLQARKAELESELSNLEQALAQLEARLQKEGTSPAASEDEAIRAPIQVDNTPVFDQPYVLGRVVARLRKGTEVHVVAKPGLWQIVAGKKGEIHGYVKETALGATSMEELRRMSSSRAQTTPGNTKGTKSTSPLSGVAGSSSPRKATQCVGLTKNGTQCERMTTDPSGYCDQHK
jgi:chromosome segregation ATPase